MSQRPLSESASLAACEEYIFGRLLEGDSEAIDAYEALPHQQWDPAVIRVIEKCRDMVANGFITVTDHHDRPHYFPVSRVERVPDSPKFAPEVDRAPVKHGRVWEWPSWL